MYGLPQAVNISNDKLKQHLEKFGYDSSPITTGLWRNQTRTLQFSLLVGDFGVQYERQADITHILDVLKTIYKIYEDWEGKIYCRISL